MMPDTSQIRAGFRASPCGALAQLLAAAALASGLVGCSGCARQTSSADGGTSSGIDARDSGLAVGAPLPLDAGEGHFQGEIVMTVEEGIDKDTSAPDELPAADRYTFTAMGDAYRWDLFERSQARGDFRLYDRSAHRFYTVMQSQAVIFSTPESSHLIADPNASFILEDRHKQGTVAGQSCELYRTEKPPYRYDICATDKFTPFPFHMMPGHLGTVLPFGAELITRGLFPMVVRVYDTSIDAGAPEKGKIRPFPHPVWTFQVVLVDPKVVDPVVFELPKFTIQRVDFLQAAPKKKR